MNPLEEIGMLYIEKEELRRDRNEWRLYANNLRMENAVQQEIIKRLQAGEPVEGIEIEVPALDQVPALTDEAPVEPEPEEQPATEEVSS